MDSIENLRKMDDDELIALGNGQYGRDYRHGRIADEIEAEIAEKYMLLPVGADGMPINVGDEITLPNGKRDSVRFITYRMTDVVFNERGWVPNLCTHAKQRTIEDVLRDVARDSRSVRYEDGEDVLTDELIAQYANEIHGMVVGDIEDVLEDFLIAFDDWDWNTDSDDRDELRKELFSKYANIISGAGK